MPTTRTANSETCKNAAATPSTATKPTIKASITVRNPPGPSRDAKTPPASTNDGKKNLHRDTTTNPPTETPPTNAPTEPEQLMFQVLKQLQEIYDASCKTKANKITIERATFETIATMFQQAYEQMKTKAPIPKSITTPAPENASILDALQQIKASIINLEAKQTARNEAKIEQCPTPKTYADTLKPPITAAQLFKHQEQQRARAEKIQSTILLNFDEADSGTRGRFLFESNENIAVIIEEAIKIQLNISCPILGISKQKNIIKIHHNMNDEDADEVTQYMNWNAIGEGLKLHESIHKVVVHDVHKDAIIFIIIVIGSHYPRISARASSCLSISYICSPFLSGLAGFHPLYYP